MEIIKKGGVSFLTSKKIGVPHGFTLRLGGVSEGAFLSLNVGLRRGDSPENARKNILRAAEALSLNKENLTLTHQTHTSCVLFVGEKEIGNGFYREWGKDGVDGIVTNIPQVPLMCYSADCVPTLLYDEKRGAIAAVHGGWRGTAGEIVKNAVRVMCERCGSNPLDIRAAIGPAIGGCCYEVSEDVGEVFKNNYPDCIYKKENGKYMLDLKRVTASQLRAAGLKEENTENSGVCTSCENEKYFSHRAQGGKSGLLGGFIQLV